MREVKRLEYDLEIAFKTGKVVVRAEDQSMSLRSVAGSRDTRVENIQGVNDRENVGDGDRPCVGLCLGCDLLKHREWREGDGGSRGGSCTRNIGMLALLTIVQRRRVGMRVDDGLVVAEGETTEKKQLQGGAELWRRERISVKSFRQVPAVATMPNGVGVTVEGDPERDGQGQQAVNGVEAEGKRTGRRCSRAKKRHERRQGGVAELDGKGMSSPSRSAQSRGGHREILPETEKSCGDGIALVNVVRQPPGSRDKTVPRVCLEKKTYF